MAEPEQHIPLEELIEDENAENPVYEPIYLQDSVEELAEQSTLKEDITKAMHTLSEREKHVLSLRYGLIDGTPMTLEEVGQILDVTRERIRQIEAKALRKLRHPSRRQYISQYAMQKSAASNKKSSKKSKIKKAEKIEKPEENSTVSLKTVETDEFKARESTIAEYVELIKIENFTETKKFIIAHMTESAVNKKVPESELFDAMDKYNLDILQYSEIYDSIAMQGYAIVSDEEYQQEKMNALH